jgi:hypothetical protein
MLTIYDHRSDIFETTSFSTSLRNLFFEIVNNHKRIDEDDDHKKVTIDLLTINERYAWDDPPDRIPEVSKFNEKRNKLLFRDCDDWPYKKKLKLTKKKQSKLKSYYTKLKKDIKKYPSFKANNNLTFSLCSHFDCGIVYDEPGTTCLNCGSNLNCFELTNSQK